MRSGAMMAGAAPAHSGEKPDRDRLRGFDRRHRHRLLQPGAAVAAQRAVDLDDALVCRLGQLGARDGDGSAGDLQDVAGPRADAREVGRRDSRAMACADVFDARFRDAQA